MSLSQSVLAPVKAWYATSIVGKANAALSKSAVREEATAKILASRPKGASPIDDYIWGVGKPRD